MSKGTAILDQKLLVLDKYLKMPGIVDICIQQPECIWLQQLNGTWIKKSDKNVTFRELNILAEHLAVAKGQRFNDQVPILATTLPRYGHRITCLGNTIVESGFALSIRVAQARKFDLNSYSFIEEAEDEPIQFEEFEEIETQIKKLEYAISHGMNMAICGATGSGKTALLNSVNPLIPKEKRIVIIEDSAEINLEHENYVRLLKSKTGTDIAATTYATMINATLRMNPDVIMVGELDVENTYPFLRTINTGHSGALTTVHANGPEKALHAMAMNASMMNYDYKTTLYYAREALDAILHVSKKKGVFTLNLKRIK